MRSSSGLFDIKDSKVQVEEVVATAKALDYAVKGIGRGLSEAEAKFETGKESASEARQEVIASKEVISGLDSRIQEVSARLQDDIDQTQQARSQGRVLSWCIEGLASEIDQLTKKISGDAQAIQTLQVELEQYRPWNHQGCSTNAWQNFSTVMKNVDRQALERCTEHGLKPSHFKDGESTR